MSPGRSIRVRKARFVVLLALLSLHVPTPSFAESAFKIYRGLEPTRVQSTSTIEKGRGQTTIGPVLQGDVIHHDFLIPNRGTAPIEIRNLKMCSGCMLDGFSERIEPGRTGHIAIVVPTDSLGGQTIDSSITADTSADATRGIEISVSLTIEEFASLSPYRVWLKGRVGDPISSSSRIVPNPAYPFSILALRARKGFWFEHTFAPFEHDGRPAYEITVTNTRTKPGPYQDVLFVQTDHPERPEFKIRIEGRIEP